MCVQVSCDHYGDQWFWQNNFVEYFEGMDRSLVLGAAVLDGVSVDTLGKTRFSQNSQSKNRFCVSKL